MKTFIRKNALFLTALVIVIVAVLVILATVRPSASYTVSSEELLKEIRDTGITVTPFWLQDQLKKNNQGIVVVDIRNSDEYARGHIQEAVNIPVLDLLKKNPQNLFRKLAKNGQVVVLYGNDEVEAGGPLLFLRQLGYNNCKLLAGGFSVYHSIPVPDSLMQALNQMIFSEKSMIDTAVFRQQEKPKGLSVEKGTDAGKEKVVPVKHSASAGGGC